MKYSTCVWLAFQNSVLRAVPATSILPVAFDAMQVELSETGSIMQVGGSPPPMPPMLSGLWPEEECISAQGQYWHVRTHLLLILQSQLFGLQSAHC